jgi:CheY-like chemotaxis protein
MEADAAQIRQIVMNLVINASESIGEKCGNISVAVQMKQCDREYLARSILGKDLADGSYVCLTVADNGSGMSRETLARIFDPFFTTKFTGRGLGLSAVLGIVRGHSGAIICSSELNKGTTFEVLFPLPESPAPLPGRREPAKDKWRGRGLDAIQVFRTAGEEIRLVLLDMTMPNLDGEETFREMRRLRPDVRTILTSGYSKQYATSKFMDHSLAAFIQKPYSFEELRSVVRNLLGD